MCRQENFRVPLPATFLKPPLLLLWYNPYYHATRGLQNIFHCTTNKNYPSLRKWSWPFLPRSEWISGHLWKVLHFKDNPQWSGDHETRVAHRERSSGLGAACLLFFPRTITCGVSFGETDVLAATFSHLYKLVQELRGKSCLLFSEGVCVACASQTLEIQAPSKWGPLWILLQHSSKNITSSVPVTYCYKKCCKLGGVKQQPFDNTVSSLQMNL